MKYDDSFDYWLTQALQQEKPYLIDEGFTKNVMAELPNPPRLQRKTHIILALPVIAISLLVLWQLPLEHLTNRIWHLLLGLDLMQLFLLGATTSASLLLSTCLWLARQMRLI